MAEKRTLFDRFSARVFFPEQDEHESLCWVWIGACNRQGYGIFQPKPQQFAHRIAWQLFNGPIPEGMYVCHHCDNPPCVRYDHLFLGTHADNMADAARKGTKRGISINARFTADQVQEIRQRYRGGGISQRQLAAAYRVKQTSIWSLLQGRHYRWLPDPG